MKCETRRIEEAGFGRRGTSSLHKHDDEAGPWTFICTRRAQPTPQRAGRLRKTPARYFPMAFAVSPAPQLRPRPWRVYAPGEWSGCRSKPLARVFLLFFWPRCCVSAALAAAAVLRRLLRDSRLHVERARGGRAAVGGLFLRRANRHGPMRSLSLFLRYALPRLNLRQPLVVSLFSFLPQLLLAGPRNKADAPRSVHSGRIEIAIALILRAFLARFFGYVAACDASRRSTFIDFKARPRPTALLLQAFDHMRSGD